ncbi:MAG: hypothetical protein RL582_593 [Bacteroidota bacterium]|jgi:uncharacterized membrane protein
MKEVVTRPVIPIKKDILDYVYLYGSYALTAFIWIYVSIKYQSLPNTIPTHFGMNGMPDGFGDKSILFLIPIIVSLMVVFLNVMCLFPHKFNYMKEITTENAEWQYKKALRLLRYLQFFISLVFSYIVYQEIEGAINKKSSLSFWFIPVLLFGIMIPTVTTVYRSLQKK